MPISQRIKISIVSYTNTLPFRWALSRSDIRDQFELQEDIPSVCAQKLADGEVDLALVPVAILASLPSYQIVSDYCIGADGIVDSVKLYSQVPVAEVTDVLLDYQSRTSVALARILFENHWKVKVKFLQSEPGFESGIQGTRAAVVIGDRTFRLNGKYNYEYDLAHEWKEFTGLPFVFAAWVSKRVLPEEFVRKFNEALRDGVNNIERAVTEEKLPSGLQREVALEYLQHRIDYALDQPKKKALALFLSYVARF
jgi:chorismate dehydratase